MATNIMEFLKGKIGKYGDSAMTYARNISKNVTVESLQDGYNTYIAQSSDELANVARRSMARKNTVMSNLNMDDFQRTFNNSEARTNAEYASSYSTLKQKIASGNIEEAREIASDISDRFGDKDYLAYLQEAEAKQISIAGQIKGAPAGAIHDKYIKDMKNKIGGNKIVDNFLDDSSKEWLAKKAYSLQGKDPRYYFATNDKKTNRIRAGVVGGAYLGGSMVVRGLQGGNPITNEYGERDIAGIPFI